jgi:hypothetical protein
MYMYAEWLHRCIIYCTLGAKHIDFIGEINRLPCETFVRKPEGKTAWEILT